MKLTTSILAVCWLLYSPLCAHSSFQFFEGGISDIRQKATEEGKLYFVHFSAKWCMPCRWMEENTFTDEAFSQYVADNWLALKLDIDDPDNAAWMRQYDVTLLPTLLIFSTRGQMLFKQEGALEADALTKLLQEFDQPRYRTMTRSAGESQAMLDCPQPTLHLERPALIPDIAATPVTPVVYEAPTFTPQKDETTSVYTSASEAQFSLQVGVYSSEENALRAKTTLEQQFPVQVQLRSMESNGRNIYRLYMGRFARKSAAEDFLEQVKQAGVDAFVKQL
ncbi:MAG TPA: SPOR domain-containing protein [Saprospiraceae bacterium]|nr:SPOR domain-containing protein [Saprospiraceae bacterium]HMQ83123.1 SPOR domain-containing protein [Saprospiraceae bacterium]